MTATVIIPTTGSNDFEQALNSVLNQTYPTNTYVVIDGLDHYSKVNDIISQMDLLPGCGIKLCTLPDNVGANGFYGHRVYAAFTHLVNTDYVLYLDQDCWFEPNHVESLVNTIEQNNIDWSYALRKITDSDGNYICNDDCESLGLWAPYTQYNHIDTNCYCLKTSIATKVASIWHGGWGQDRVFFNILFQHFRNVRCNGEYTVNYRLGGNEGSVKTDFFLLGNKVVEQRYNGAYPWRKI